MSDGVSADQEPRRPRINRPTPSHLFAKRHAAEPGDEHEGERLHRPTRVIPSLARSQPSGPAAAAPAAEAPASPPPDKAVPRQDSASEYPPDLVFIVRADGTVLYVNRPLGRRGEDDVIGSDICDWIFPEQHAVVREVLQRVFATGRADGHELRGIQEYNPEAWYECRISPNMRDGAVVSSTIIARDVTRYKRAEQALRAEHDETVQLLAERTGDLERAKTELASRDEGDAAMNKLRRFRSLLDAAGEAVFITDGRSQRLIDINETACRWLRSQREDVIGREAQALGLEFDIIPPDDLDLQFTETRDTRRPLVLDGGLHRRSDGSTFPVEVTVAHHVIGENSYVLAVVRDVKGRRRAEEALQEKEACYQALFLQSWDAVFLTTRAGAITAVNHASVEMFGYEEADLIGMNARELLPRPDDIRAFQRRIAEQGVVQDLAVEVRRADGSTSPALLAASCLRGADGALHGYQWLLRVAPAPVPASPDSGENGSTLQGTVLVVEHEERALAEVQSALEHAGLRVLSASDPARGVELYRAHRGEVAATVLAAALAESATGTAVHEIRALDPEAPIVLLSPDDPYALAERFGHLQIAAFLRKPTHPLTLVQTVRDLLAAAANGA